MAVGYVKAGGDRIDKDADRRVQEAMALVFGHLCRPGDTVMRVPADCDPAFETSQVFHHTAIVGCAGSFAADPWSKLVALTRSARSSTPPFRKIFGWIDN